MNANLGKVIPWGIGATLALLGLYFGTLALVSGWDFTLGQFRTYRYFVIALAAGFGIQVGLFVHLKALVQGARKQGVVLATSGTASSNQGACQMRGRILIATCAPGTPALKCTEYLVRRTIPTEQTRRP